MRRPMWMTAVAIATAATIAAASGVAFAGSAETIKLSARMDARQVVPQKPKGNVTRATGTFTGTLGGSGSVRKLSWEITYRNLDHPSIVIADIHYGKRGKFGPIIVRLCGPCKSGQHGVRKVKGSWVPAIKAGNSFITLITGKNPNGEIRGQIRAR
jgi:CHRD domain